MFVRDAFKVVKSYEVLIEHYEAEDIAIKKDYVLWNFVKSSAFTLDQKQSVMSGTLVWLADSIESEIASLP